jgi:thiamine kinase-like enzyme
MGNSTVRLVEFDGHRCIEKSEVSAVERGFYEVVAPQIVKLGVQSPQVLSLSESSLVMEYIPQAVSLSELPKSLEAMQQLANLHSASIGGSFPISQHRWSKEATSQALAHLELPDFSVDALEHIQSTEHSIFSAKSYISGDTNSGNWGRRYSGELVLFDWERFGLGCPTIDLAPLVAGMGSIDEFESIIEQYAKVGSGNLPSAPLKNLIVAKAWIAIEVVNILVDRNNSQKNKYLDWFNNTLPDWMYKVASVI